MNARRVEKLISLLRSIPSSALDMSCWVEERQCGTVGCIAGWTVIMERGPHHAHQLSAREMQATAQELLGISDDQAKRLFLGVEVDGKFGPFTLVDLDMVKRHHAVRVLEIMLDTGKIDWKEVMK